MWTKTKRTFWLLALTTVVLFVVCLSILRMDNHSYTRINVLTEEYYSNTDFGKSSSLTLEELKLPRNRSIYMLYLFYCVDDSLSLSKEYKTDNEFTVKIKIADTDKLTSTDQWDKLPETNYKVKSIMFDGKTVLLSTADATHINPVDGYLVLDENMLTRLCFE